MNSKKNIEAKLKNQAIDSTFIRNKSGSIKNNNHLLSDKAKQDNVIVREHNEEIREYNESHPNEKPKKMKEKKHLLIIIVTMVGKNILRYLLLLILQEIH